MKISTRLAICLLLGLSGAGRADVWSESVELEINGQYNNAAKLMDPLLDQQPSNEFARLRRGWLNYLAGNYNSSQTDYKLALHANPLSLDAQIGMTLPLLAQQRWKEAAVFSRQALQVSPWNYYAHLRLILAEEGQQQWQILLDHTRQLHQRYPADATVLVYHARAQLWLGQKNEARNTYQQVLQRAPGNLEAQAYLQGDS